MKHTSSLSAMLTPSSLKWILVIATTLTPFLFYFDTAHSIVSIWGSSETFAHGYIILPISLWLIWRQRESFIHLTPTPYWPALLAIAACGFGWLLAELGGVQVVRQYTFVAMIPLAAIALLGLRISWILAFPLAFVMLAVPFGEIFVESLINITADFTVAAVQFTGIPLLREGNNFSIPTGNWSVVEACSGVRYLIASFTLGTLYAYLTYRSIKRRALFILISILVPIAANGLRAYMIVMIGHLSGMTMAVGVDHLIYGWAFFGLVMFLMFWIGSYWREDEQQPLTSKVASNSLHVTAPPVSSRVMLAAAVSTVVCIGMWPVYAQIIERTTHNPDQVELKNFQTNWQDAVPFTTWKPSIAPSQAELHRFYQKNSQSVGIIVNYYRNQKKGAQLISSLNRLVPYEGQEWNRAGISARSELIQNKTQTLLETRINGKTLKFVVWHWYSINGKSTISDYTGKLLQAKNKLLLQGDDGVSVMVLAPYEDNPEDARTLMRDFLTDNLSLLESMLSNNIK